MKRLALALAGLALLAAPAAAASDAKAEARLRDIGLFLAVVDKLADRCGLDAASVAASKQSRRARGLKLASAERLRQVEEQERAQLVDAVVARMDCKFIREAVAAQ